MLFKVNNVFIYTILVNFSLKNIRICNGRTKVKKKWVSIHMNQSTIAQSDKEVWKWSLVSLNCCFYFQIRTEKMIEKKHGLEPCQEVDLEEENDVLLNNLSLDAL